VPRGREAEGGRSADEAFAEEGCAFVSNTGTTGAAFVDVGFTRRALDGLFRLEEYRPRGHGSTDLYFLRRLG
jgi:hypothetical protein